MLIVKEYIRSDGYSPFSKWLSKQDGTLKYRIQARIFKLKEDGHFGFTKRLSDCLFELKFRTLGGGVRIYYGLDGKHLVILLCGGDKSTQQRDILQAKRNWADYISRKSEEE
tara:strand:+ start:4105 stop:4440 length:336 start_codon:yes stop_codon:yes gene_type:complete